MSDVTSVPHRTKCVSGIVRCTRRIASTSEAFSNSIGEALACGVPVVTTDIGDSATLVGDAGHVVKVDDSVAMGTACLEILQMTEAERRRISLRARERMQQHYEIGVIANRYLELWESIVALPRRQVA